MTLKARRVTIDGTGFIFTQADLPAFAKPRIIETAGTIPTFTFAPFMAAVQQRRFELPFTRPTGKLNLVVIDKKTYFQPDFHFEGNTLVWDGTPLALGTKVYFENIGDATTNPHVELECLFVQDNQTVIELGGTPFGGLTELYINGVCYPESAGSFVERDSRIFWTHRTIKLKATDKVFALYPKTAQGASLFIQVTQRVEPSSSKTISLADNVPTIYTRVFRNGLRLLKPTDYNDVAQGVQILDSNPFSHGEFVAVMGISALGAIEPPEDTGGGTGGGDPGGGDPGGGGTNLPAQSFVRTSTDVAGNGPTEVQLNANVSPNGKAIVSMDGLAYLEGFGVDIIANTLHWQDEDTPLKAGDEIQVYGFQSTRLANAFVFKELTPLVGSPADYPEFDLGEVTVDMGKMLVVVSADDSFGGLMHGGPAWVTPIDDRKFAWSGAYALKPTDKVIVAYLKDAGAASELRLVRRVITAAEAGLPFAMTLPTRPTEPTRVIAAQNGAILHNPREFTMNDDQFVYYAPNRVVREGDEFLFFYH